jgi:hypothetical protein
MDPEIRNSSGSKPEDFRIKMTSAAKDCISLPKVSNAGEIIEKMVTDIK